MRKSSLGALDVSEDPHVLVNMAASPPRLHLRDDVESPSASPSGPPSGPEDEIDSDYENDSGFESEGGGEGGGGEARSSEGAGRGVVANLNSTLTGVEDEEIAYDSDFEESTGLDRPDPAGVTDVLEEERVPTAMDDLVDGTDTEAAGGWEEIDFKDVEVLHQIGGGGAGIVYSGRFQGAPVALKTLFDPNIDDALKQEFMDELLVRVTQHTLTRACTAFLSLTCVHARAPQRRR
jgi:hypothetical protein